MITLGQSLPSVLWHVSSVPLAPDTMLEQGRFARIMRSRPPKLGPRELALEKARLTWAPNAVSRLDCTYAFEDRENAARYIEMGLRDGKDDWVYEVEPRANAAWSRHDVVWFTWMGEPRANTEPEWLAGLRRDYWLGVSTRELLPTAQTVWELLIGSPLRVLRCVRAPGQSGIG